MGALPKRSSGTLEFEEQESDPGSVLRVNRTVPLREHRPRVRCSASMAQPALTFPIFDVEAALRQLPAAMLARLAWARKPIEDGIQQLTEQPLTDELVATVAKSTWRALASVQNAFTKIAVENQDAWSAKVVDDMKSEEEILSALVDADAANTLNWVLGFLHGLSTIFMASAAKQPELPDAAVDELAEDVNFQPYVRGLVALMAASAIAKKPNGDRQRVHDLLSISFLQLNRFVATLRGHGVFVTPFPGEGMEERRQRVLASADRVRRTLSDTDWAALRDARLRNIR